MKYLRLFLVLIALALTLCLLASCKTQDTTDTEEPGIDPSGSTGETVHIHAFGEWEVTVPSTCISEGTQQRSCECGETETMAVALSAHTEVIDEAVPATCSSTGLTEGKHCSVCEAVIEAQTTIPKTAHSEVTDPATAATCSKPGLSEGKHCSICGAVTVKQITIPQKAHTYTDRYDATCNVCGYERDPDCAHTQTQTLAGIAASCTQSGLTEGKKCTKCEEILVAQEIIPIKEHTVVVDAAKASTCTQAGLTEGKHCSVCSAVLVAQQPTPLKPHSEVVDPAVEPTYDSTGLTEGKHCSVCSTVLVPQQIIEKIPTVWHRIIYFDEKTPGEWPKYETYKEHEGVNKMPVLSLDGWTFDGWYTEYEGGKKIPFIPAGSTQDYTLYAHWSINEYTINYVDAYHHSNPATYKTTDNVVLSEPFRSGMKFDGWTDQNGNTITQIPKGSTGDVTLTAHWRSYRNLAVSSGNTLLDSVYDETAERYYFIYELGVIENVVLDNILTTYNKTTSIGHTMELSKSVTVDESHARTIAKTTGETVTKSQGWSNTFTESEMAEAGFNFELTAGTEIGKEGVWKASLEAKFGVNYSHGAEITNDTTSSGGIDQSQSMTNNIAYATELSTGSSEQTTLTIDIPGDMPNGYYAYVHAGNVRVFAIVTFDVNANKYSINTYSVMDNMHDMVMYYPTVTDMNSNATNGELAMDIPVNSITELIKSSHYVRYDPNGGAGSMPVSVFQNNTDVTLAKNTFTKTGYHFAGWELRTETGVQHMDDGHKVKDLASGGKTVTLYAKWNPNPYKVVYNGNKPSGASSSVQNVPGSIDCTYDTAFTLGSAPTLTGWTFGGWYTDSACKNKAGNAGQTVKNLTAEKNGTVTLYAKWTANTYAVTYNANGGSGSMTASKFTYDVSGTLSACAYTRANYTFLGWSTNKSATTSTYANKQAVTNLAPNGNVTLYAIWVKTSYYTEFSGRSIELGEGASHTDHIPTGMSKQALLDNGYKTITIEVIFDGQREDLISFNSAQLAIVNNKGSLCGVNFALTLLSKKDDWTENIKETYTINVTDLNDDGSFSIKWSHLSGSGNGEHWTLGTTSVNITANK